MDVAYAHCVGECCVCELSGRVHCFEWDLRVVCVCAKSCLRNLMCEGGLRCRRSMFTRGCYVCKMLFAARVFVVKLICDRCVR